MQYNFDAIQEAQDRNLLQLFNKVDAHDDEPEESEKWFDFENEEIDEDEEVWQTADGLVPMHKIIAYANDVWEGTVSDVWEAIELVEKDGGKQI